MGGAGTRKEERHAYAALICDDADESAYLGLSVQRAGLPVRSFRDLASALSAWRIDPGGLIVLAVRAGYLWIQAGQIRGRRGRSGTYLCGGRRSGGHAPVERTFAGHADSCLGTAGSWWRAASLSRPGDIHRDLVPHAHLKVCQALAGNGLEGRVPMFSGGQHPIRREIAASVHALQISSLRQGSLHHGPSDRR